MHSREDKYFVTYCTQGTELDSNILEHACLFISKLPDNSDKIEVLNAWGFYTERWDPKQSSSCGIGGMRKTCGLDFDLSGNPGTLKQEKLRYFDQGRGLHGMTFEISAEQANRLADLCKSEMQNEQQAINEAKEKLIAMGIANPTPHQILECEEDHARKTHTPSRLQRFEIKTTISTSPFEKSSTCKTRAIDLLAKIGIEKKHLDKLQKHSHAFPRFSGKLEEILLHSVGELYEFKKPDQSISLFRDWAGKAMRGGRIADGRLYWALPPQLLIATSHELNTFKLPEQCVQPVKALISKLLKLEKIFEYEMIVKKINCKPLIDSIQRYFKYFALASDFQSIENTEHKMQKIKKFFNGLYDAIKNKVQDMSPPEAIVSNLSQKSKNEILKIIENEIDSDLSDEETPSPELIRFC